MKRILLFSLMLLTINVYAQNDSNYYETYKDKIVGRIYFSQKYVHAHLPGINDNIKDLEYETNAKLNAGIGITVKGVSLNIFYGFNALNKKDKEKGKTTGLDLQLHVYPKKWSIDVLVESPKGFHLEPKGYIAPPGQVYYYRPDIKMTMFGVSAYRIPNKEKFSYRAAILQTEWQKKSAGSVLYGGSIYSGKIKGDSALVPRAIQNNYSQQGITSINFISFGPGVGYAYTLVLEKHFFLTASLIGNMNVNITSEKPSADEKKTSFGPATVYKAGIGYNSSNWSVGVNWTGNTVWFKGPSTNEHYSWPSGQYRLMISKKFNRRK